MKLRELSHPHTHLLTYSLFAASLAIYAFTRLYALDEFPIYFFTDEAVHPVYGVELVRNHFRDATQNLFPTYFQNGQYWNLSFSVYLHALTAMLFGKSILVTRATSAILSIVGVAALGWMLKEIFKARLWWIGGLFAAITPAWFLHSRTAFETVLMVSFYALFLLCYLFYRYRSPRWIFPALLFGAATFYSYSNGQAVMLVSGVLLLLSDARYHLKNLRLAFWSLGFGLLLFLPYLRFRLLHPDAVTAQFSVLNSYWLQPLPWQDKLIRFIGNYAYGLSPQYWLAPNVPELARHVMLGYGNILWWVAPFILIGMVIAFRNWKSSAHRVLIIAALAAPFGSALAEIGITRVLAFIIPANIFAALGMDALVARLRETRFSVSPRSEAEWGQKNGFLRSSEIATFVLLALASVWMLRDALVNGPTWHTNYGLYGMQWGTQQIFADALPPVLADDPNATIYVSHTWANGADIFLRFFDLDRRRVRMESILGFLDRQLPLDDDALFVMTREEFAVAQVNPKLKPLVVEQVIAYPDGTAGFYLARVGYSDHAAALFAAERAAMRELVTESFDLNGAPAEITHNKFDMGSLRQVFDGDAYSVARGVEANPFVLDIALAQPRAVKHLTGIFGRVRFKLFAQVYAPGAPQPVEYTAAFDFAENVPGQFSGPPATIVFDRGPAQVSRVRLQIQYLDGGDAAHVHIFDLKLE
ncbi:MAG: glycosyltransferase family 39 protein [Chloroflexi bacterium]|nr:glycosyltransferase family 39 protein [Chloroflexota bacterium]